MQRTVVIHYAEIGLKGENRTALEKKLAENIRRAAEASGLELAGLERARGRLLCTVLPEAEKKVESVLQTVFGIQYFALADELPTREEDILRQAELRLEQLRQAGTQRIALRTRRGDKRLPFTSLDLNKKIGAAANRLGLKIDFENPEQTLHIEIGSSTTYLYAEKIPGPGGLPVSSSGKVLCLLSGGIDSAVAAWLLLKRGCRVDFLHFHTFRENREVLETKIRALVETLNRYQFAAKLFLVPYHTYQMETIGRVPESLDLVVFKNFMFRLAARLARRRHYRALATGDSLGQVASQTLPNLAATDVGIDLPVLRPLLGYDKQEIVDLAKRVGTYADSIREYKDCCSIIARKPATAVPRPEMEKLLAALPLDAVAEKSIAQMEMVRLTPAPAEGLRQAKTATVS